MAKAVRFLKKQSPYNEGETAGFPDALAQRYVDAGVAVFAPPKTVLDDGVEGDAEFWKKKFYDLGQSIDAKTKDIEVYVTGIEKERDGLKGQVTELEEKLRTTEEHQVGAATRLNELTDAVATKDSRIAELESQLASQSSAKPEVEGAAIVQQAAVQKLAGNEAAAETDKPANVQSSAADEGVSNAATQGETSGSEASQTAGKKSGGRK